jgi:hypothetical protein
MTTLGIIFLSILCLGIIVFFILVDNNIINFDIASLAFIIFFTIMFTLTMIAEYDNLTKPGSYFHNNDPVYVFPTYPY